MPKIMYDKRARSMSPVPFACLSIGKSLKNLLFSNVKSPVVHKECVTTGERRFFIRALRPRSGRCNGHVE